MYYDVYANLDKKEAIRVEPTTENYGMKNVYCPKSIECNPNCKEYKCDRFWGEVENCGNCANRYNTLKCPVAKYYETKDNDICSWHERRSDG